MVENSKCVGCKFNKETTGSYCYCAKKQNRVRMSDNTKCTYVENEPEDKWFNKILKMCEFKGEHKHG